MKHILHIILFTVYLCSCGTDIKIDATVDYSPTIYPDYKWVTIPPNIAPLNFSIDGDGEYGAIISAGDNKVSILAEGKYNDITISPKCWQKLTAASDGKIKVTVCRKEDGKWIGLQPFEITVSTVSIDKTLVYRLIPPLYGTWREIGIYQRDLESYDEVPIYQNTSYQGNCVNCHSFCVTNPEKMLFHLRGPGGGTYLKTDDIRCKLDTKTDSTIANFTYPYWHPSGRYVAFSVNDIFQIFHTIDPNRAEVIDDASDIVIYDVANATAFSTPELKRPDRLETFPAFSADGKTLYYCSAAANDTLPENYAKIKYSLLSIAFDPETGEFGSEVDTLYSATSDASGLSVAVPRPSPDGKRIVATFSPYGQFKIWHSDADLWEYEIDRDEWSPLTAINSDKTESYHSWSSNSRWLVFSSRRDDGLYTRPYIAHVDNNGNWSKPFMLPQKSPKKYYLDQKNSYNIPELVSGKVELTTLDVVDWIEEPTTKVKYGQK